MKIMTDRGNPYTNMDCWSVIIQQLIAECRSFDVMINSKMTTVNTTTQHPKNKQKKLLPSELPSGQDTILVNLKDALKTCNDQTTIIHTVISRWKEEYAEGLESSSVRIASEGLVESLLFGSRHDPADDFLELDIAWKDICKAWNELTTFKLDGFYPYTNTPATDRIRMRIRLPEDAWNRIDKAVNTLHETYPKIPLLLQEIPIRMFHDTQLSKMGLVHRNPYPVLFRLMGTNSTLKMMVDTALKNASCQPTFKYRDDATDPWNHKAEEYPWHETSTYCVPLRVPNM